MALSPPAGAPLGIGGLLPTYPGDLPPPAISGGLNLHAIANPAIQGVNPNKSIKLSLYAGKVSAPGLPDEAIYNDIFVRAQEQPLSTKNLQHINYLGLQGTIHRFYLYGVTQAIVRSLLKGGDLITLPDGTVWLVTIVFEQWPNWCSVGATLQNE